MWYLWDVILGEEGIGESIRTWRINLGLTIAEASRRADIASGVWGRIESGATANPLYGTVAKMFIAMGAQIDVKAAPRGHIWTQDTLPEVAVAPSQPPVAPKRRSGSRVRADG